MENNNFKTNTNWSVWTHSVSNNSWDLSSYNKIFTINNLYDYIYLASIINNNLLLKHMFFIMRNNILPLWESEDNKNGCTYSFKVPFKLVKPELDLIIYKCISESISKDTNNYKNINGLSIVPKKSFCIVKLWFRSSNTSLKDINTYGSHITESNSIKKTN